MTIFIDLQHVTFQGAETTLLNDLSLTISSGDRIGVVGINGAGKSTLLRIVAGLLKPDAGTVLRARGVRVSMLEQLPDLPDGSIRHALGEGWEIDAALDRLNMLEAVDQHVAELSGGQMKRVALARILSDAGEVLILDEPTNHLDLGAIQWLEQHIIAFPGAVLLVSHDRFLLDRVTTRMVEIDRGQVFVHGGGYSRLLEAQAEREERAASAEQTRRNLARTELAWLRRGVKARSTKPQARIDAAERLLARRPDAPAREGALDLSIVMPRLGSTVAKMHNVSFAYDDARPVLVDVNLDLGPGDRVGVVGANGAGKSTLADLLTGKIAPSRGTVKIGPTVVASHFEQHGGTFDEEKNVQELVAGDYGVPGCPEDVALMRRFWFTGATTKTKARDLSGGERRRLQLLLALSSRPNFLVLDEPTNDLDLETIRLVEEFLRQWGGTLVVVSHDRTFLSRTTDRLLEVHANGMVSEVPGGIDAWIARTSLAPSGSTGATDPARGATTPPSPTRGRQLRDAEKQMASLERRRTTLHQKLVTTTEYEEQLRLGKELATVQAQLSVAEEEWLSLIE